MAGGLIAIVAFPVWAGFDRLVDPAHGAEFTRIRLLLELPLVETLAEPVHGLGGAIPSS